MPYWRSGITTLVSFKNFTRNPNPAPQTASPAAITPRLEIEELPLNMLIPFLDDVRKNIGFVNFAFCNMDNLIREVFKHGEIMTRKDNGRPAVAKQRNDPFYHGNA